MMFFPALSVGSLKQRFNMVTILKSLLSASLALSLLISGCSGGDSRTASLIQDNSGEETLLDASGDTQPDFSGGDLKEVMLPDFSSFDGTPDVTGTCDGSPPYPFGCPCEGNTQCLSGYCVESIFGFVCTEECLEECAQGWFCRGISGFGSDLVFVCMPESRKLCYPCEQDSQCGGGFCVEMDDGRYCTYECDESGESLCTASFQCESVAIGEQTRELCMPTSGSCSCTASTEGQMQTCEVTNDLGTCYGFSHCDPESGWMDCSARVPSPEVCDGLDNDCNGSIDEGLPESMDCQKEGEGGAVCSGKAFCYGAQGWVCTAPEPSEEVCDYKDNDCNGIVDDPFTDDDGKYTGVDNCGSCNVTCAVGFPNATTTCDATRQPPLCVVDQCSAGYYKLNDFQCVPTFSQLCESCSTDDNCLSDGARCVELSDGRYCSKSCAVDSDCPAGYGCINHEGEDLCIPLTNSCTCDGVNTLLSRSCAASWPTTPLPGEAVITCFGIQNCTTQGWSDCLLPVDVCDGTDNDCNGVVDDAWMVDGKYTTDENCGDCGNNCTFLVYANGYGACDASLSVPQCRMVCAPGFLDVNKNPADGCECQPSQGEDLPDGVDSNCDGVDGDVQNAVFVAKDGNDDQPGTIGLPMLTIQAAMDRAVELGKKDVYVATGVYAESISIVTGLRIYGGFSSTFLTRNVTLNTTVIMGQGFTAELPGAVTGRDVDGAPGTTVLDGFTIFGRNNANPGGSSYAVYLRNCTNALRFSHNRVEAGTGGTGLKGVDGANGQPGNGDIPGEAAYGWNNTSCSNPVRNGGSAGTGACTGTTVSGGIGGGNLCPVYNSAPTATESGVDGSGPEGGDGGLGGYDREVWACTLNYGHGECHEATGGSRTGSDGYPGASGNNGNTSGGNGCPAQNASGDVSDGMWAANSGMVGLAGTSGSGGGGGGSGGGARGCNRTDIGGSGGGGGAGGCGGTGGTGGSGGGGSFGLFLVWDSEPASVPQIVQNHVFGSLGGSGGNGGTAGSGGPGGSGGMGGKENVSTSPCGSAGGTGGDGGNGGHGEGGGGGCGGASFGLFAHGNASISLDDYKLAYDQGGNSFFSGSGGSGGSGGPSIGNPGELGADGPAGATNF